MGKNFRPSEVCLMIGAYCCGSQIETGLSLQCLHATWDALCLTGSWLPQQSCHGLEDSAQPTKALVLLFIPKYCKLGAQCHFRLLTEQWMELMVKTNMQISMHTAGISADFSITWSSCVPPMKHPSSTWADRRASGVSGNPAISSKAIRSCVVPLSGFWREFLGVEMS
jgi:hypothetical protein